MAQVDRWLALRQARARDALLTVHAYCEQPNCTARTVDVFVKDYNRELLAVVDAHGVRCPLCGNQLILHSVRTRDEQDDDDEQQARRSVNVQRYRRDQGDDVGIPLSTFLDDELPD